MCVPVPGSSSRCLDMHDESRRLAVDYQLLQHQATARQGQMDAALQSLAEAREALAVERAAFKMAQRWPNCRRREGSRQAVCRSIDLIESSAAGPGQDMLLAMVEQGRFEDAVSVLD